MIVVGDTGISTPYKPGKQDGVSVEILSFDWSFTFNRGFLIVDKPLAHEVFATENVSLDLRKRAKDSAAPPLPPEGYLDNTRFQAANKGSYT